MRVILYILMSLPLTLSAGESLLDSLQRVIPNAEGELKIRLLASLVYEHEHLGNYTEALRIGEPALKEADSLGYNLGSGMLYNHLGAVYKAKGDFTKALDYLQKAERIFIKIKNARGMASMQLNLGNLYNSMGQIKKAEENYFKSLEYGKKMNDSSVMAVCMANIGAIKHNQNKLDEAEKYYLASLQIRERTGDSTGAATLYNNIGIVFFDRGNYTKAEEYYRKYYELAVHFNMQIDAVIGTLNLGEISTYLGRFDEGVEMLQNGLQKAIELHSRELELSSYETLESVWERKGNYEKALLYAEQVRSLKDSILSEENARTMAELETAFQTEKKEQEISLLTKENTIRDLATKTAEAELTRKNTLKYGSTAAVILLVLILLFFLRNATFQKRANRELEEKNKEVDLQNTILEQKNALIHDSIEYAGIIQQTLFPTDKLLEKDFGKINFVKKEGQLIANYACAFEQTLAHSVFFFVQSHLHGVSGSLHSLRVYHEMRNQCITENQFDPSAVSDYLRSHVSKQWEGVAIYKSKDSTDLKVVGDKDIEKQLTS